MSQVRDLRQWNGIHRILPTQKPLEQVLMEWDLCQTIEQKPSPQKSPDFGQ